MKLWAHRNANNIGAFVVRAEMMAPWGWTAMNRDLLDVFVVTVQCDNNYSIRWDQYFSPDKADR
jgi:hypothetical protein